jgi:hypothetical protein
MDNVQNCDSCTVPVTFIPTTLHSLSTISTEIEGIYIYIYIYMCVCVCVCVCMLYDKKRKEEHKYSAPETRINVPLFPV